MLRTTLDSPAIPKVRTRVLATQTTVYICVLLMAAVGAFAYKFRADTIFACQADGYSADRYIAYCNGANYADYEHGAFGFGLEPSVQNFARNADVLFLGNSHMQVAFSTKSTSDWFSTASIRYYLMGFTYYENVVFAEPLLRRIKPNAKVYVINVDDFFNRWETPPAKAILDDPDGRSRYEMKRLWQRIHEPVCKGLPALCGDDLVYYRSRETGAYTKRPGRQRITPVSYDQSVDQAVVSSNTAAAIDFLSHLPVKRDCVILTMTPTVGTKIGNANAIAKALGETLVAPEIPELQTFDTSHLQQESAERWSAAFFQLAGSKIEACLKHEDTAHP